ncbi:MAG: formate dehydrogenase accessory sulfurtransferase FdhD, partial [Hyphomicrobiaceae bacterium]
MSDATVYRQSLKVTAQAVVTQDRCVPQEVPVAFVYDGSTYAVMMASPSDLEDFAIGFSLTEGVVATPDEVENLEIVEQTGGIELRMWLAAHRRRDLAERRRRLTGPTGCGLCGVESLDAAVP